MPLGTSSMRRGEVTVVLLQWHTSENLMMKCSGGTERQKFQINEILLGASIHWLGKVFFC